MILTTNDKNGNIRTSPICLATEVSSRLSVANRVRHGVLCLAVGAVLMMASSKNAVAADPVARGAGNLVAHQQADGNWLGETGFTGECVAGLVNAYLQTGTTTYLTAAQNGGEYCLYDEGGYDGSTYSVGLFASGAYGLARLGQVDTSHDWSEGVRNFYGQIKNGVGAQTYVNSILSHAEATGAVYDLARHSVAASLVGAAEANVFRSNLIAALGGVKNSSSAPVMALGAAVWALGETGGFDSSVVSTASTSYFYNVPLSNLPGMLASHQAPDGSFYTTYNNDTPGFTETTAMASLGLIAASSDLQSYRSQIFLAQTRLGQGVDSDGFTSWAIGGGASQYFFTTGETLEVLPEPVTVVGLCLGFLAVQGRKRRVGRCARP